MNRFTVAATSMAGLMCWSMGDALGADAIADDSGPRVLPSASRHASIGAGSQPDGAMSPPLPANAAKRDEGLDWLLVQQNAMKAMGWLGARWIARSGFNDGCLSSSDPRTIANLAGLPSYVARTCIESPLRIGYAPTYVTGTNLALGFSGQYVIGRAFDGTQKTAYEWATIGCDLGLAMRHRSVEVHFQF
jgi:hypothetical protein